jgi:hypothetical protein
MKRKNKLTHIERNKDRLVLDELLVFRPSIGEKLCGSLKVARICQRQFAQGYCQPA